MSQIKCIVKDKKAIWFIPFSEYLKKQPDNRSFLADYHFIQEEMGHMMGEILTIIDASIIGTQNKAIKDLIKTIFVNEYCKLTELMHSQEDFEEMGIIEDDEIESLEEVSRDEALGIK